MSDINQAMLTAMQQKLGERANDFLIPPPVFTTMQAKMVASDADTKTLVVHVPVLEAYFNPFHAVQGGMIAAAVDNALGPLSFFIAPTNVTRRLEMTYSKPITKEAETMVVTAKFLRQEGNQLFFSADVRDIHGTRLARAKATHWIVESNF